MLNRISDCESIGVDGVARTYRVKGFKGTFGLISSISKCFCQDCNRIRITSDGKLKPCLHSKDEIDLKGLKGEELHKILNLGYMKSRKVIILIKQKVKV